MTKNLVETLLFASVAINAALLLFIAGVLRKMMNAVDAATFKNLIDLMVRYSTKSPFMIIALNIPLLIAMPYYYFYGFSNWWLTAGIALWLVAGSIAKVFKLPVYKAIASLKSDEADQLKVQRRKFNMGNIAQAALYSAAVVLMLFGLN